MKNQFTDLLSCRWPIIGAPMFLVGTVDMVAAISNEGGVGTIPTLNFRSLEELDQGLGEIRKKTTQTYGVNLIVHKSNPRWQEDLDVCVKHKVPFFITSLGSPKEVIAKVSTYGGKVFCDVTNVKHAKKALEHGADGLIAVCAGAGGHAGPHSPFSLVSELKKITNKPIIVAGAVANGSTILASLALGAQGVSIGTRFIATHEAHASAEYKQAIVNSAAADIEKSIKMTGIPAAVIKTPESAGLFKPPGLIEKIIFIIEKKNQGKTAFTKKLRKLVGLNWSWKNVWSAGESVGQVESVDSCSNIMKNLIQEMKQAKNSLPDMDK